MSDIIYSQYLYDIVFTKPIDYVISFGNNVQVAGDGDMLKSVYDTDDDGIVNESDVITGQGELATMDVADLNIPTQLSELSGDSDDVAEGTTNYYVTSAEKTILSNTSGTNTGDQESSDYDIKDLTDSTSLRTTWSGKQDALGFTAENVSNKITAFQVTPDDSHYPSEKLVKDSLDGKQASGSYEVTTNKKTSLTDNSDTYYPSQKAVKTAVDAKVDANVAITGSTKTKITYDAKGLVTSGTDATTADIADSSNKRYCTDAEKTVIGNTSNTNTGDETQSTIKTKLGAATASVDGYATSAQITKLDGIEAGAEVNNISDVNATDLTDSGATTLHKHSYSNLDDKPTIPSSVVWYETKTWCVQGEIKTPSSGADVLPPFEVLLSTNQTAKIVSWHGCIESGTSATFKLQASNGSGGAFGDVTGFTAFEISGGYTNPSSSNPNDYTLTAGEVIQPVCTAVSGTPKNLSLTVVIEYTKTI